MEYKLGKIDLSINLFDVKLFCHLVASSNYRCSLLLTTKTLTAAFFLVQCRVHCTNTRPKSDSVSSSIALCSCASVPISLVAAKCNDSLVLAVHSIYKGRRTQLSLHHWVTKDQCKQYPYPIGHTLTHRHGNTKNFN
jgi:hypothetical protein